MEDSLREGVSLMIELLVESVRINLKTQQRVVILRALDQERYIFIWIAHAEAYAIAVHLQKSSSPRPLTHDVMKNLIESMGARVLRVTISDLVDEIFYSQIVLDIGGKEIEVDTRPSDAIALAVRVNAPIFVAEQVMERCSIDPKNTTSASSAELEKAKQGQAGVDTDVGVEVTEATKLKERLAQVEEELKKAQARIAELEGQ
jgi:bifunctional DNase/RNase